MSKNSKNRDITFDEIDLWPDDVQGANLHDEIVATIKRFIICNEETAIATALWCSFTWLIDHVQVAPIAVITAPEMRCGKSQLLNIIQRLSKKPLIASNISPAAMYRVIELCQPTLLIDEADTFLKENEELRGVVNSGHTRDSAYAIRSVGNDHTPKQFSTWSAKAICGIGSVAGTIQDRAIMLEMRRKLPNETVERIRHAEPDLFETLRSKLARFAEDAAEYIANAKPILPENLNDRAQDNWEPLLAIADYLGDKWPELARETALKVSGIQQEVKSTSIELLSDVQEIFELKNISKIKTSELIKQLIEDDEKPWATYNRGKAIAPRQLSKRLSEYGIKSRDIRFDSDGVKKGYEKSQFLDAFNRYLSDEVEISATTQQISDQSNITGQSGVAYSNNCSATNSLSATAKLPENLDCSVVADKKDELKSNIIEVEL